MKENKKNERDKETNNAKKKAQGEVRREAEMLRCPGVGLGETIHHSWGTAEQWELLDQRDKLPLIIASGTLVIIGLLQC